MEKKFSRIIINKIYERVFNKVSSDIVSGLDAFNSDELAGYVSECIYYVLDLYNRGDLDRYGASYLPAPTKRLKKEQVVPLPHHEKQHVPGKPVRVVSVKK